jgi:hypothetical protein
MCARIGGAQTNLWLTRAGMFLARGQSLQRRADAFLFAQPKHQRKKRKNIMKRFNRVVVLAGVIAALGLTTGNLAAQGQGRGNFNAEEFRQRMMERMRERLEVKSDDEWKVIEQRLGKVMDAQRETRAGIGFGGFGGGGRGPRPEGDNNAGGDNNNRRGGRGGFGGEPSAEVKALEDAITAKASNDELKAKMAKIREARKEKEAALEKAQDDLRKVVNTRQEAQLVLAGMLK